MRWYNMIFVLELLDVVICVECFKTHQQNGEEQQEK